MKQWFIITKKTLFIIVIFITFNNEADISCQRQPDFWCFTCSLRRSLSLLFLCTDVAECTQNKTACKNGSRCSNSSGSFSCSEHLSHSPKLTSHKSTNSTGQTGKWRVDSAWERELGETSLGLGRKGWPQMKELKSKHGQKSKKEWVSEKEWKEALKGDKAGEERMMKE